MTRPPGFAIVTERTGALAYLRLHGELDLASAQLDRRLRLVDDPDEA